MTECIIRLSSNQVSFEKGVKRMDCTIISLVELSDKALETIRSSDKGPHQTEMKKPWAGGEQNVLKSNPGA